MHRSSNPSHRARWSALGAAIAVTLGAGGLSMADAAQSGPDPVTITVTPARILDTRSSIGLPGRSVDESPRDLQVTGTVAVAPSGTQQVVPPDAVAVLVNVTVVRPSSSGFLSLRPAGTAGAPTTSTVNFEAGVNTPNAATVDLPVDGQVEIWLDTTTPGGTADVLLDVVGYTIDHDHDDRYPTRTEFDGALAGKADAAGVYSKSQVDGALAGKADAGSVYSKSQVDGALAGKADAAGVYSKSQVDAALAGVANDHAVAFAPGTNTTLSSVGPVETVATMNIDAPSAGFVVIVGTGQVGIASGAQATCLISFDGIPQVSANMTVAGRTVYSNTVGLAVTAGAHTVTLQCAQPSGAVGGVDIFAPWISATFSTNQL